VLKAKAARSRPGFKPVAAIVPDSPLIRTRLVDRDTPIARIVPYTVQPLELRRAKRRLRDLKLPPKPSKRTDSVAILVDDRRRR
jgi:hypothetical protein